MMGSGRIKAIDVAKGLGMLFIMWGHIMRYGISNHRVYVFHIPLFFFLSGLVFSYDRYGDFKTFLKRKFHTLLVPYFFYSVVTWAIWAAYSYITHSEVDSYWMPLLQTFIAQGSAGFLVHNGTLWFVTCLFVVECLYWLIGRLPIGVRIAVLVICAALGVFMSTYKGPVDFRLLPWNIEVAFMAIVFYAGGVLVKNKWSLELVNNGIKTHTLLSIILSALLAFVVYIVAVVNGKVSMGHADPGNYPVLFYVGAFCGIAMVYIVSVLISDMLGKHSFIEWFGKNSYCVMAIHNPIKGVVVVAVAKLFHSTVHTVNSSYFHAFIAFVLSCMVTSVFTYLISHLESRRVVLKNNALKENNG